MKKLELVVAVAEKTGLPRKEVALVLDKLTETVKEEVIKGDKVQLVGFGAFYPKERAERVCNNPRTHEKVTVPASKTIGFRPGSELKHI